MEYDEDGLGGGGDDDNVALANACEICGNTDFFSEAGFYYCKLCNTQSQQSVMFVEAELAPDRTTNIRQVTVLQKERARTARAHANADKMWMSSWEVFNIILEGMTKVLIRIGFPPRLRDKVFQLWTAYLLKREAILVKPKSPFDLPKTRVSANEHALNFYALQGVKPSPVTRFVKSTPKNKGDNEVPLGLAQERRKKTMARRKAFEIDYLAHASQMSGQDLAYENVTGAPEMRTTGEDGSQFNNSGGTTGEQNKQKLIYTKTVKRLRKALEPGKKRTTSTLISRLTKVEKFNLESVLILLFIAARQIGCSVLLSDFIRLFNDGTLYLDRMEHVLEDDEEFLGQYIGSHSLFLQRLGYQLTPACGNRVESLIGFIGIKKFSFPSFEEFLPKFARDFALPKEFECFVSEIQKMIPVSEILEDMGGARTDLKSLIEVLVLAIMFAVLKMLYGLDDVTEKYQNKFASSVNRILANQLNRPDLTYQQRLLLKQKEGEMVELFDLEDWFKYLRYREDLISQEMYNGGCYKPQLKGSIRRIDDIKETYGEIRKLPNESQTSASSKINELFKNLTTKFIGEIPELPSYTSLPHPKESILLQYKSAYPNVSCPVKANVLNWNFENKRVDFLWNPEKYIPLLNKAGYKVKIIEGDASNYKKKLKVGEKKLILFQPFKKFDDYSPPNSSASMKFIIGLCNDILNGKNRYGELPPSLFQGILNVVADLYTRRVLSGSVPLKDLGLCD